VLVFCGLRGTAGIGFLIRRRLTGWRELEKNLAVLNYKRMRLFVAIALAEVVRAEVGAVVAQLRPKAENLRWTAPDSWHVTLQFLGNAGREQLESLIARLGEVHSAAVKIQLTAPGIFERAGVLHVGVKLTQQLEELQQSVVVATGRCGFGAGDRPFHPHITLARAKGQGRGRDMSKLGLGLKGAPVFTPFIAEEFLLYESFTEPRGARYEVRARFQLDGPAEG
jgi:RNA 2',3'-cyclic 3'-phosphodiesterase